MKNSLFIFVFIFYPIICLSNNNYDICETLNEKIISNRIAKELRKPEIYEYSHGFYPITTFDSDFKNYLRDEDNYLILGVSYGLFLPNIISVCARTAVFILAGACRSRRQLPTN